MNPGIVTKASAVSMAFLLISSCNPQDPSALSENQKALAEAMAKNINLAEELAELKIELEEAKASQSEAVKMPSRAEVEKMLDLEGSKLKETAREQSPGSEVVSFGTWDLNVPSFERPFSCKAKLVLKSTDKLPQTLYWVGSANLKGEWTFTKAENLEPEKSIQILEGPKVPDKDDDDTGWIGPGEGREPVMEPEGRKQRKDPQPPPVQEKPKPKYDIPLDKPVMGPGAR